MILRNVGKKLSKLEEWNVNSKNAVLESLIEKSDDKEVVKEKFVQLPEQLFLCHQNRYIEQLRLAQEHEFPFRLHARKLKL